MLILGRTPAQVYALVFGASLVLSGVAGFLVDASFTHGAEVHSHALVIYQTNGWHNALHVIAGLIGLAAFSRPSSARHFAIGWGSTAAILAVWGLLTSYPVLGLIPTGVGGIVLHLFDASVGIFAWKMSAPPLERSIAV